MKLSEQQIISVKIILSGKSKLQLSKELGIVQTNFSQLEKYPGSKLKLLKYFDEINPDINKLVDQLTEEIPNEANEPVAEYKKISRFDIKDDYISFLKNQIEEKDKQIRLILGEQQNKQTGSD